MSSSAQSASPFAGALAGTPDHHQRFRRTVGGAPDATIIMRLTFVAVEPERWRRRSQSICVTVHATTAPPSYINAGGLVGPNRGSNESYANGAVGVFPSERYLGLVGLECRQHVNIRIRQVQYRQRGAWFLAFVKGVKRNHYSNLCIGCGHRRIAPPSLEAWLPAPFSLLSQDKATGRDTMPAAQAPLASHFDAIRVI
jgi:hypothetical protein